MRTPLTSIRGHLELLLADTALGEEQRRFLAIADRNSERLLGLVNDLLLVAEIDAGKLALDLQPVDLEGIVEECIESSLPAAGAKGVELTLRTTELPELEGDPARLGQVLDNLVSNALKFTEPGGRVEVRLGAVDGTAVLEVEDTGLGSRRATGSNSSSASSAALRRRRTRSPGPGSAWRSPRRSSSGTAGGSGSTARWAWARPCGSSCPAAVRG